MVELKTIIIFVTLPFASTLEDINAYDLGYSNSIGASVLRQFRSLGPSLTPQHMQIVPPKCEVRHAVSQQSKTEESLFPWDRPNKTEAWKLFHAITHSSSCAFRLVP